ncbi:Tetratricopeptide repeat-containing domain protein [Kalmanozyma brasiliensis GHG001]|uniref:Cns1/TTC4 wheel domain-containing protein n=1 Tax=Kalmanozyma brasiliensis (strain GHG001) TaxID=1365824 RepID=V5ETL5_KALBG|nr:Tetratricopeptide repeat-containing domain protein [Kalmanozyma brasiliensis GHG001]EST05379.1 Tetratricopeptide repeat-containing domain protein [Kalmanozyma brasiliensis GHG001]
MAVIESIADSSQPSSSTSASSTAKAALPKPPPRSGDFTYAQPTSAPRNLDETLKSWDSVPLFMKDLPTESDPATDSALEALQSLAFDGTPDEVASNFKSQANDYFKSKRYREALGFYTQAIDASPEDKALLETLYANRAACNLELQNYGAALRDTSAVLGLNPRSEKAYYRATRALLALDRCQDAIDCADHGLGVNSGNDAIRALKVKAESRLKAQAQAAADATERKRREEGMSKTLQQALLVRGLWLETTPRPPDNPQPAHFDPESLPEQSSLKLPLSSKWTPPDVIRTPLVVPLFFMYPQHAQSDFISDYHEDTPLATYISTMFPASARGSLPWDGKGEYYEGNLQVYATTRRQRLLKLGKKLTLREVMDQAFKEGDSAKGEDKIRDRDGLVMQDGILSLVVLPKGEAEKRWVDEFKAQREKAGKK